MENIAVPSARTTSASGCLVGSTLDRADALLVVAAAAMGRRRGGALGATFLPDLLTTELPIADIFGQI